MFRIRNCLHSLSAYGLSCREKHCEDKMSGNQDVVSGVLTGRRVCQLLAFPLLCRLLEPRATFSSPVGTGAPASALSSGVLGLGAGQGAVGVVEPQRCWTKGFSVPGLVPRERCGLRMAHKVDGPWILQPCSPPNQSPPTTRRPRTRPSRTSLGSGVSRCLWVLDFLMAVSLPLSVSCISVMSHLSLLTTLNLWVP